MGKYSGAFDEAEAEFDEEFAGKLVKSDFSDKALADLTPEGGPDKEAMEKFIAEVKAAANAEAAKDAWLNLSGKVGSVLLKAAKKVITSGLAILFLVIGAQAGILDLDPFLDGVGKASKRTRAGLAVNLKGTTKGVGYIPLAWDDKRGYWDIGLGINAKKFNNGSIGVGLGLNLVNLGHDLLKNIFKDRVGLLPVPGLYIGPVISTPSFDNITARWDYREKIDFYITYALFGSKETK
ncbi:MAG: hypothetical protein ABIH23_27635 [bacterium]